MVILFCLASCKPNPKMTLFGTLLLYFDQQAVFKPRIQRPPSISLQSFSTLSSQLSALLGYSACSILRLHQLSLSLGLQLFLNGVRLKVGDLSVVSVSIDTAQYQSVQQDSSSPFLQRFVSCSITWHKLVKSVPLMYFSKLLTFQTAYSFQDISCFLSCLNLSAPNNVSPIPYIRMVVDCILVEPASAIQPTLQLILHIFSLCMNFLDLSTLLSKIQSVLPYKMYGFRLVSSVDFQTAPITQQVSPPSVLPINKSFSWKPSYTSCCSANQG